MTRSSWCPVTRERGGVGESGREVQEGGNLCILMTDAHCYTAETNTILQSNYPPIKNKLRLKTIKKMTRSIPVFGQAGLILHHSKAC